MDTYSMDKNVWIETLDNVFLLVSWTLDTDMIQYQQVTRQIF